MHEKKSIAHSQFFSLRERRMEKLFLCMLQNRYHNLIPALSRPAFFFSTSTPKTYNFLLRLKIQNISFAFLFHARQCVFQTNDCSRRGRRNYFCVFKLFVGEWWMVNAKVLYFTRKKGNLLFFMESKNSQ